MKLFNPNKAKRTKFRMGATKGDKPESAPIGSSAKRKPDSSIMLAVDEPIHAVCRRIRKAGYTHKFVYGDRFYLSLDLNFDAVDPDWIIYPKEDVVESNPDLAISCAERGVWLPRVEEAFQIMMDDYEYHPCTCSQARLHRNYCLAFTKMRLKPTVELLAVVQEKCPSYLLAVLRCLEQVIAGNVKEKWVLW